LTALASLPTLLKDIRKTTVNSFNYPLYKAKHLKDSLSKNSFILEQELKDPSIAYETAAPPTACLPIGYEFRDERIAWRYCLYWSGIIFANNILILVGDEDASLSQETQISAENICKSLEYYRRLKSKDMCGHPFVISAAYGVSSKERRIKLDIVMEDFFSDLPMKIGPQTMEYCFNLLTSKIVVS
jgi:hypothetical protein